MIPERLLDKELLLTDPFYLIFEKLSLVISAGTQIRVVDLIWSKTYFIICSLFFLSFVESVNLIIFSRDIVCTLI